MMPNDTLCFVLHGVEALGCCNTMIFGLLSMQYVCDLEMGQEVIGV